MFGIKLKVLMSTSLVDDSIVSHSPPVLTPAPKGVIKGKPLNIAIFGINLKVQWPKWALLTSGPNCDLLRGYHDLDPTPLRGQKG